MIGAPGDAVAMSGAPPDSALFIVGRVRRAHGIRGEVAVEPYTSAPEVVFAPGRRVFGGTAAGDPGPRPVELHVEHAEPLGSGWRVRFAEIPDRTTAELWRDRYLLAPRDELPPPDETQLYLHELVGLRVELADGSPVGEVVSWYEVPHGILLEVARGDGTVLLPYRPEFVREVDREGKRLVVELPDGLLEL